MNEILFMIGDWPVHTGEALIGISALALLLLTMREGNSITTKLSPSLRWPAYLLLEIILGLALVLPADLWIVRGLQGLLRDSIIAIPIRTLHILDLTTFVLNLLTGPLLCLTIGIIMRLFSTTIRRVQ